MSKDVSKKEESKQSFSQEKNENESLIAKGKGIWPLIISVFLVVIYNLISVTMLLISHKFGRL